MKLSDRCRKEARDFYLYDNKDCVEWKAADLLDECETLIGAMRQEIQNLGGSLEGVITADATLAKLRGQEKADEVIG